MNPYSIDHKSKTIICTKKFYDQSTKLDTPECKECQRLREAFPDYTFTIREIKRKENKRVANKNLTYPNMVRYIASRPEGTEKLVEFAQIRNLANQKGRSYDVVKDWFLENFPAYVIPGVSDKELDGADLFISLDTARKLIDEFGNCETLEEIKDVVFTHFGDTAKEVFPLDMAS